ncbi:hypothetical protein MED121_01035 [Marinomonas sp. MED121]|nr:hypothetical protein MED121_01035 [Marinomonas sp. MED121]
MNFNPVASGEGFTERRFPERIQYDREQKFAVQKDQVAPDIAKNWKSWHGVTSLFFSFHYICFRYRPS